MQTAPLQTSRYAGNDRAHRPHAAGYAVCGTYDFARFNDAWKE